MTGDVYAPCMCMPPSYRLTSDE